METKTTSSKADMLSRYFPEHLKNAVRLAFLNNRLEEIRIRVNRPIEIVTSRGRYFQKNGDGTRPTVTKSDCDRLFEAFCMHSVYSFEETVKKGFLTLPLGFRVGLAGKAVMSEGKLQSFSDVCFFNIRTAKQVFGCAEHVLPKLIDSSGRVRSTLVLSRPNAGKTTLLRDLARLLSRSEKVCIVDERSEIAGCEYGIPINDVGFSTDVFDGVSKAVGMSMAVRLLSPTVIITDEIGSDEDKSAVFEASLCGISVIASAHADSVEEALKRNNIGSLIKEGLFSMLVEIKDGFGQREYICTDLREKENCL